MIFGRIGLQGVQGKRGGMDMDHNAADDDAPEGMPLLGLL